MLQVVAIRTDVEWTPEPGAIYALLLQITGLKPGTEYILCVKAIYDDGSFLWSESKAYMTKI